MATESEIRDALLGLVSEDAKIRSVWDKKILRAYRGESSNVCDLEKAKADFIDQLHAAISRPEFPNADFVRKFVKLRYDDRMRDLAAIKQARGQYGRMPLPLLSPWILTPHLAAYAEPALPEILQMLGETNDVTLAESACELLTMPGQWALPAVDPVLNVARTDRAFSQPNRVALALVALEPVAPLILDRLIEQLSDPNERHRQAAAIILRHFGDKASKAISALLARLEDANGDVRSASARALGKIGVGNDNVIAAIFRLVHDPEWYVRGTALAALGELSAPSDQMIPLLIEALKEDFGTPDWSVPDIAVSALAKYGPAARAAIPELRRLLKRMDGEAADNTFTLPRKTLKALEAVSGDSINT